MGNTNPYSRLKDYYYNQINDSNLIIINGNINRILKLENKVLKKNQLLGIINDKLNNKNNRSDLIAISFIKVILNKLVSSSNILLNLEYTNKIYDKIWYGYILELVQKYKYRYLYKCFCLVDIGNDDLIYYYVNINLDGSFSYRTMKYTNNILNELLVSILSLNEVFIPNDDSIDYMARLLKSNVNDNVDIICFSSKRFLDKSDCISTLIDSIYYKYNIFIDILDYKDQAKYKYIAINYVLKNDKFISNLNDKNINSYISLDDDSIDIFDLSSNKFINLEFEEVYSDKNLVDNYLTKINDLFNKNNITSI